MSFQSAIPRQVALQQCLPLLHRLGTILNNQCCRTMILQRAATTPLTPCLSPRVHSRPPPPPRYPVNGKRTPTCAFSSGKSCPCLVTPQDFDALIGVNDWR